MAAESLKEYLVKLGWDVDELGFSQATSKIDQFNKNILSIGTSTISSFAKAGLAVTSFIAGANGLMIKLLDNTAKADLAADRFARKMWTSKENARSFTIALDAMGAKYEDIFYMTPEEYNRFMDLKSFGNSIQAPAGLKEGLKLVRDIRHEFNRLKVIASYATQWISFYLTKYMGKDLQNIKNSFKSFNDWLVSNLPNITAKVATFFTIMFKLGKTVVQTIQVLLDLLKRLWDSLSDTSKKTVSVVAGFAALFALGPIGLFIAALLTLLLLLDDFYTWQRGGKSAWGSTWEKFSKGFGEMDTSVFGDLQEKLNTMLETFSLVGEVLWELGGDFVDFLKEIGFFNKAWEILTGTLEAVVDILQTIADLILVITGNFDKLNDSSIFRKIVKFDENGNVEIGKTALNTGMGLLEGASDIWNTVLGAEKGDWYAAPDFSRAFGYHYGTEQATRAAGIDVDSKRGGGSFGGKSPNVFTQTNRIYVTAAPGESATTTAQKTSKAILKQRDQYDPFK